MCVLLPKAHKRVTLWVLPYKQVATTADEDGQAADEAAAAAETARKRRLKKRPVGTRTWHDLAAGDSDEEPDGASEEKQAEVQEIGTSHHPTPRCYIHLFTSPPTPISTAEVKKGVLMHNGVQPLRAGEMRERLALTLPAARRRSVAATRIIRKVTKKRRYCVCAPDLYTPLCIASHSVPLQQAWSSQAPVVKLLRHCSTNISIAACTAGR